MKFAEGLPAQSRMFGLEDTANRCVRIAGSMKAMWSMWGMALQVLHCPPYAGPCGL